MKYKLTDTIKNLDKSLPTRGVWIEIAFEPESGQFELSVTPHTGSVD